MKLWHSSCRKKRTESIEGCLSLGGLRRRVLAWVRARQRFTNAVVVYTQRQNLVTHQEGGAGVKGLQHCSERRSSVGPPLVWIPLRYGWTWRHTGSVWRPAAHLSTDVAAGPVDPAGCQICCPSWCHKCLIVDQSGQAIRCRHSWASIALLRHGRRKPCLERQHMWPEDVLHILLSCWCLMSLLGVTDRRRTWPPRLSHQQLGHLTSQ